MNVFCVIIQKIIFKLSKGGNALISIIMDMSKTPVNDFIIEYKNNGYSRFHMPGHKGEILHGLENMDITEINGADYLYESQGIIARSESLTAKIFGAGKTLYSTEGSSLSIKTMLGIIKSCQRDIGRTVIAAPRNVHKAFIDGCCLLDIDVEWIYPQRMSEQICSSSVTADDVKQTIDGCGRMPDAVYITSPDYLGNIADIEAISAVCREKNVPLLVDNAHGAYLKFLERSLHPLDLGADMCADSAHKTLPVYTGGGYLHISKNAPKEWRESAKEIMSLFASTSPSYLIMGSLDKCCGELMDTLPDRIRECAKRVKKAAEVIASAGWDIKNFEPLKLTVFTEKCGYSGNKLAQLLREKKIECEYSDPSCVVLMCSPYNKEQDFQRLENAFGDIPILRERKAGIGGVIPKAKVKMPIREAYFSRHEKVKTEDALGRICARAAVSCQPSVPVVVPGEEITGEVMKILKRYSIFYVDVI